MKPFRCAVAASVYLPRVRSPFLSRAPYVPAVMLSALGAAGAAPFLVSHDAGIPPETYLPMMDALVLPGGANLPPDFYGAEPGLRLGEWYRPRDLFDRALFLAAWRAGIPILAFCGGMQLANVALGGTLWQNIQCDVPGSFIQHAQKAPAEEKTHSVTIEEGTVLRRIFGASCRVNSLHREAVRTVADGLAVAARSPDGIIEGLQSAKGDIFVGVQWHPEFLWKEEERMRHLFTDLGVRAARRLRGERL